MEVIWEEVVALYSFQIGKVVQEVWWMRVHGSEL